MTYFDEMKRAMEWLAEKSDTLFLGQAVGFPGTAMSNTLTGVSASDILQVEGEYYGLPVREIGEAKIPFEILRYIPEESAAYYRLVPLGIVDKVLCSVPMRAAR
jgi:hypothetical protein